MGIVPKAEMEPFMQMILSFLTLIVMCLLLCLTIPSIWSLKSNTKVKSLLFSMFTTCSSKRWRRRRTSFRFYYFETMYIVIDISNQESRVCSLLANIVAWEQSLEVHRHEHQLSQEGHNPTPPFTEIHFSKTKNTLNNTQYSVCNGCHFLSGTRACISQIVCCSHFPNYNLYKALRLGNKEGQDATAIGSQTVFLFMLGRLLAEADTWLWQNWWN